MPDKETINEEEEEKDKKDGPKEEAEDKGVEKSKEKRPIKGKEPYKEGAIRSLKFAGAFSLACVSSYFVMFILLPFCAFSGALVILSIALVSVALISGLAIGISLLAALVYGIMHFTAEKKMTNQSENNKAIETQGLDDSDLEKRHEIELEGKFENEYKTDSENKIESENERDDEFGTSDIDDVKEEGHESEISNEVDGELKGERVSESEEANAGLGNLEISERPDEAVTDEEEKPENKESIVMDAINVIKQQCSTSEPEPVHYNAHDNNAQESLKKDFGDKKPKPHDKSSDSKTKT
ncbi:MAG: hypothetical protein LBJ09_00290 [Clostridiales bacterium]|jgi:hypothetical protein|nr:hypothetical protein [Clostridiales bacterium]